MIKTTTTEIDRPHHGTVMTRHIEGSIVESCYTGYCSQAAVASVLALAPEVLAKVPSTRWLLDLGGVSAFDSGCRIPGGEILKMFRERGGDRFAVVVKSGALRMTLAAVAFAARLPIKLFDNRMEALVWLRARDTDRSAACAFPASARGGSRRERWTQRPRSKTKEPWMKPPSKPRS